MKKIVLALFLLAGLFPATSQAKVYRHRIEGTKVTHHYKMYVISRAYMKKMGVDHLTYRQRMGVYQAAVHAKVILNKNCPQVCRYNYLVWQDLYIDWTLEWYRKYDKKHKSKCETKKCCNGCGCKCKIKIDKRKYVHKTTINNYYKKINITKKVYYGDYAYRVRFNPYLEENSVLVRGFFLESGLHNCSFSRGGGLIVDGTLLGKWGSTIGRLEFSLGGAVAHFAKGGHANVFVGNVSMLLGKSYGHLLRFQVLGGVSGDILYAKGDLAGDRVRLLEGAFKGLVMARLDTLWVSGEVRAALGIGGHDYNEYFAMMRAEASVQAEVHLTWWLDIIGFGGIRYDFLDGTKKDTYNLLLKGKIAARFYPYYNLMVEVGIEAGKYYNYWDYKYYMPYVGIGFRW